MMSISDTDRLRIATRTRAWSTRHIYRPSRIPRGTDCPLPFVRIGRDRAARHTWSEDTMTDQVESPTYKITRVGWDSFGIDYICWTSGQCYAWSAWI